MGTVVPLETADTAITAASDIAWSHLARTIGCHTTAQLRQAVLAVSGIRWSGAVLNAIAANRINFELSRLRNSEFPEREYERLSSLLKESYAASSAFPPELLEWRTLAIQLRLDVAHGWDALLNVANFLQSKGPTTPYHLGVLSPAEFRPFSETSPNGAILRAFWASARSSNASPTAGTVLVPYHDTIDKPALTKALRAHSAQMDRPGKIILRTT